MQGILLLDKPKGWTSFDVVNYVRKIVARIDGKKPKNTKVGHSGTLDPMATGLLVLAVGQATKQIITLIKCDKTYEVEITLGAFSSTDDAEGVIEAVNELKPSLDQVNDALGRNTGVIEQVPPIYSAVKVDGKRAYELARAGKDVKLKPRTVQIYEITKVEYRYPTLRFAVNVSSGTYIRSLARTIGEQLECGAYVSELRRTVVGEYSIESAISPEQVTEAELKKHLS